MKSENTLSENSITDLKKAGGWMIFCAICCLLLSAYTALTTFARFMFISETLSFIVTTVFSIASLVLSVYSSILLLLHATQLRKYATTKTNSDIEKSFSSYVKFWRTCTILIIVSVVSTVISTILQLIQIQSYDY